jgi:hypothetical protein
LATLYAKSGLDLETKTECKRIESVLGELQKFVVKLRRTTIIRQELGTALNTPVKTRWMSWLTMVDCFILNADKIKEVIQQHRPEFLPLFVSVYEEERTTFEIYRTMLKPIEIRIKKLEVSKYLLMFWQKHLLGRQNSYNVTLCISFPITSFYLDFIENRLKQIDQIYGESGN